MTETTHQKLQNYSNTLDIQVDDREAEARALLSCASRLRSAIDDQGKDLEAYGNAIRHNQRLWTMFQVALCEPDNQLPQGLKTTLLNLGRYVDKASFRAVQEFSPHLLNSMIDINRMIATGLRHKVPGSETQAQTPVQSSSVPRQAERPTTSTVMTSA